MPRRSEPGPATAPPLEAPIRVVLALLAGWLAPGLGHVLLGYARRGLVFAALILFTYGLGLAHDGNLALVNPQQPFLSSMQVVANAGVGLPDLAARLAVYGEPAYRLGGASYLPKTVERLETLRRRLRSPVSIYGTAYVWTAGLMNLLLLFDLWDRVRGRRGP